jgi:glycosyltransferase involved in cell wall biosynthesis
LETYKLIPHKIVKSDWLQALLARDGFPTHKIRLGMDLKMFYPREVAKPSHPVVLAMTRPRTPRRGFPFVVDALKSVKSARPDAEIVVFGDEAASRWMPFPHRNEGVVSNQDHLAKLYSMADVFLDGSSFQGFGRPALEAMACGAACVLTEVGGVTEYARDGKNCLLAPPERPVVFADNILRILADENLKANLIAGGFETAKEYCHKREARETLTYFHQILGAPFSLLPERDMMR